MIKEVLHYVSIMGKILGATILATIFFVLLMIKSPSEFMSGLEIGFMVSGFVLVPLFVVFVIYKIIEKPLTLTGVLDQPNNTEKTPFLGKNWRKTVSVAVIILFVSGLLMFLVYNFFIHLGKR